MQMKVKEMVRDNKVKWAIACVIIGLVFAVGIALVSCSGIASVGGIGANQAVADAADGVVENVDLPEAETESIGQEADDETGTEKAESISGDEATAQGKAAPSQGSAEDAQHQRSTGEPKGNSAVPSQSASQKKWVEDTERVWVVDREAWTESVPIYSTVEVSICNICGTDITGNTSAHAKEHMKAGEGSGHHSEIRQIVTGYNTVSHKEEGHWETKVVGGHWE